MIELSIALGKSNTKGLCAWIEDQDDGHLTIHADRCTDDAESVCRHAAEKVRLLADAFDILAMMDNPCTTRAQEAAMTIAAELRGQEGRE